MVVVPPINTFASEVILIALIAVVLFVIFKVGKSILKLIFGLIINSILGIIAIFALNYFFRMGIPLELATLIPTALFGLPAVGTFVILRFFGIL
ncbi:MAG: pro-sigmaK processing inhibitor BofA family protein [Candidatus Micrarchaeota archaeon]|nr:pro-sigmaK processing inhibitor BofA family protein [Candidatus Micrarchaeota archaeon]